MRAFRVPHGAPQRLLEKSSQSETGTQSTVRDKFDPLGLIAFLSSYLLALRDKFGAHVLLTSVEEMAPKKAQPAKSAKEPVPEGEQQKAPKNAKPQAPKVAAKEAKPQAPEEAAAPEEAEPQAPDGAAEQPAAAAPEEAAEQPAATAAGEAAEQPAAAAPGEVAGQPAAAAPGEAAEAKEAKPQARKEAAKEAKPQAPKEAAKEAKPQPPKEAALEVKPQAPVGGAKEAKPQAPKEAAKEAKPQPPKEAAQGEKPQAPVGGAKEAKPQAPNEAAKEAKPLPPKEAAQEAKPQASVGGANEAKPQAPKEAAKEAKPQATEKAKKKEHWLRPGVTIPGYEADRDASSSGRHSTTFSAGEIGEMTDVELEAYKAAGPPPIDGGEWDVPKIVGTAPIGQSWQDRKWRTRYREPYRKGTANVARLIVDEKGNLARFHVSTDTTPTAYYFVEGQKTTWEAEELQWVADWLEEKEDAPEAEARAEKGHAADQQSGGKTSQAKKGHAEEKATQGSGGSTQKLWSAPDPAKKKAPRSSVGQPIVRDTDKDVLEDWLSESDTIAHRVRSGRERTPEPDRQRATEEMRRKMQARQAEDKKIFDGLKWRYKRQAAENEADLMARI